jgi:RNA polymerase sigma-70 factor, ECF subfamily
LRSVLESRRLVEELHKKYAGAMYDKCLYMLGDRAEAEDAVQEVFIRAYRLLLASDEPTHFSRRPWLYRIATFICLHMLRTRRRKGTRPIDSADGNQSPVVNQENRTHYRQLLTKLQDSLDERSLAILIAHFIDGMTQAEIAESLGISRRAVVKRLAGLRRRMGEQIESELGHV